MIQKVMMTFSVFYQRPLSVLAWQWTGATTELLSKSLTECIRKCVCIHTHTQQHTHEANQRRLTFSKGDEWLLFSSDMRHAELCLEFLRSTLDNKAQLTQCRGQTLVPLLSHGQIDWSSQHHSRNTQKKGKINSNTQAVKGQQRTQWRITTDLGKNLIPCPLEKN